MPSLSPLVRILVLVMMIASAFLANTLVGETAGYGIVILYLALAGILRQHFRFILYVTLPILTALLIVWGAVMHHGPDGGSGVGYAFSVWLRVAAVGGIFQWFLLPLVDRPVHLRRFLMRMRAPASLGALIVAPVIFLPEVQRRITRVTEAKKAQGRRISGVAGAMALPGMLAPVVASLLESAIIRADLWEQRGFLDCSLRPCDTQMESAAPIFPLLGAIAMLAVCVLVKSPWS